MLMAGFRYRWRKTEAAAQDRAGSVWPLLHWEQQGISQASEVKPGTIFPGSAGFITVFYIVQSRQLAARVIVNDLLTYFVATKQVCCKWRLVPAPGMFIWRGSGCSPEIRGQSPPEAETLCRQCLQILTAETIIIWKFCTVHLLIVDQSVLRWGLSGMFGG